VLDPKTARDAIYFMLKAQHAYPDETTISATLDTLASCSVEEIWAAVKAYLLQPTVRPATGGELREWILRHRPAPAAVQLHEHQWESHRITPHEKQEVIRGLTPKARAFLREAVPDLMTDVPVTAEEVEAAESSAALEQRLSLQARQARAQQFDDR